MLLSVAQVSFQYFLFLSYPVSTAHFLAGRSAYEISGLLAMLSRISKSVLLLHLTFGTCNNANADM